MMRILLLSILYYQLLVPSDGRNLRKYNNGADDESIFWTRQLHDEDTDNFISSQHLQTNNKYNSDSGVTRLSPIFKKENAREFAKPQPRIVGGIEAEKERYPSLVSLMLDPEFAPPDSEISFCGGSLIAPEWVLTAGHCNGLANRVQIGREDYAGIDKDYEEIEIDFTVIHPSFNNATLDNDVMLIKLKTPSKYPAIKLYDGSFKITEETEFTVMGFGLTRSFGSPSEVLLETKVDLIPYSECAKRYAFFGGITRNMFCAARRGSDACQGDSGGPIIVQKGPEVEEDMQVGIVSWGIGCGNFLFPGVYVRIDKIYGFIEETISTSPSVAPSVSTNLQEKDEFIVNETEEETIEPP